MHSPLHAELPAQGSVLWLTRDAILALDFQEAFKEAGLNVVDVHDRLAQYNVLVIDADGLGRNLRAIVRRHRINHAKMIVIADSRKIALSLGGPDAIWLTKPVCSEELVDRLKTLVSPAAATDEGPDAALSSPG